jgi:F420-0:gamma-glutamyl ligase-like protein
MRIVWGYLLGVLCHFGQRLIKRLREYQLNQVANISRQFWGMWFFSALLFGSEGGIDGSNLPYSYVSLP